MKQKYPNEEVIAPGTVIISQVETVPILESGRTCPSKRRWLYLLYQFIAR
jgi:hypothetical protein